MRRRIHVILRLDERGVWKEEWGKRGGERGVGKEGLRFRV